ncbi:MAG: SUF system Fe-S cluster assembly protein [Chitinophagaceae bacterium]|nr:MAG: SUF system Fe-S cluster assembly protein [Chitinophagaceae bacterium]
MPDRSFAEIKNDIIEIIKTIYDPEIPVNIYDLGLIYEVNVDPANNVHLVMTLTSPNCPVAESLPQEVKDKIKTVPGVNSVDLELTFDPTWDQDMMTEAAKLELGFL